MVHPITSDSARFTGVPLLVVKMLSSNRADDLVLRTGKYAAAGAPNYWIVDPRERCLDAYSLDDGLYRKVAHADDSRPSSVPLGSGSYVADIRTLLG